MQRCRLFHTGRHAQHFSDVVQHGLPYHEVLLVVRGDYSGAMIDDERLVGSNVRHLCELVHRGVLTGRLVRCSTRFYWVCERGQHVSRCDAWIRQTQPPEKGRKGGVAIRGDLYCDVSIRSRFINGRVF